MMTDDELWAQYARLSETSRYLPATNRAWAIDDALSFILNHLEAGTGAQCTAQQIENRIGNSTAKFRKRGMLEEKYIRPTETPAPTEDRVEIEQRLSRCTARERTLLVAAGMGYGINEIARAMDAPIGSMKTWTFRARAKCNRDQLGAA